MAFPITNETETLTIPGRFQGPPGVANGGYVSGVLAERLGGAAEVTLRKPTPVDRPILLKERGTGSWLEDDGQVLVAARSASLELELPCRPSFEAATIARDRFDENGHPFRHCFVCGPERNCADGLRIFAGPVSEGVVAAPWVPDPSLSVDATAGAEIPARFVWSALDCPGAMAAAAGRVRPMLLGHITGVQDRPVHAGEPCVVIGWHRATSGRKHEVATALLDGRGNVAARSVQIWIEPRA